ncbi:MAG: hypothetical protein K8T90_19965 [Planctomycetes bacterium]|nr:hypothetical protein [Planctomycetota bacterium]
MPSAATTDSVSSIKSTPASGAWDAFVPRMPSWGESVRRLDIADRRELLARADAEWATHSPHVGEPDADRALLAVMGVYSSLHADLEPADALDCARIGRLISAGPAYGYEALMRATIERAADKEVAQSARLVEAQRDLVNSDFGRAEATYVDVLRIAGDRMPALRGSAAVSYARLCLELRRDVEALVLARRGSQACDAAGDRQGALFGRLVETHVLMSLEDWPRLGVAIRALDADLGSAPPATRRSLACGVVAISTEFALGEKRWDDAIRLDLESDRLAREMKSLAWSAADRHLVAAEVHFGRGEPAAALAEIEAGIALPTDDAWVTTFLATWRVRLKAALGHEDLGEIAATWIDDLESAVGRTLGPGYALRVAQQGAAALHAAGGHPDLARRAYRIAASAALTRIAEIDRFTNEFPEYAMPTREELETIGDHRRRTEDREGALRSAVAQLLTDEISSGRWPLDILAPEGSHVACCAWCGRLRNRSGAWMPMPETLATLPHDVVDLTHAICQDCARKLSLQLAA